MIQPPPASLEPEPLSVRATFTVPTRSGPALAIGGVFGCVVPEGAEVVVTVVSALDVEVDEVLDVEVEVLVVRPPLAAHAGSATAIARTPHTRRIDPGLSIILLKHLLA
jgi:hypothetical protein